MSNSEYLDYMDKASRGVCPVCDIAYTDHEYPERIPCPKCGSIEHVEIWEAWGHPNGDLYCQLCTGFFSRESTEDYWTFTKVDGEVVIIDWTTTQS